MDHAHQFHRAGDEHIWLNPDGLFFAALFVWSMLGLWLYLDLRHKEQVCGVVLLFIAGPAAWLTAIWNAVHRHVVEQRLARKRAIIRRREHREHWGRN